VFSCLNIIAQPYHFFLRLDDLLVALGGWSYFETWLLRRGFLEEVILVLWLVEIGIDR
jgi:hypothetical protein